MSEINGEVASSSSLGRNCERKLHDCHGCSSSNGGDKEMVHVSKKQVVLSSFSRDGDDGGDVDDDGGVLLFLLLTHVTFMCDYFIYSGDPTMYEDFWKRADKETTVVTSGWQYMSYFSDVKNVCWFLEPTFASAVTRLHEVVGNAITDGRHIVVGTGSSQLYQAAIYALSPANASEPMNVVSAIPFYSVKLL
ncbi:hypothetical protein OSB04_004724 [Centaurea solstitialis]|uniref:Alliinase C-terminal domain-containing protein n=1 Tax=Centaurea solstitialis TaxID=347529 RepID=A0AA38WR16_9ASTR|nr:hypothetical protein OSB04_004724 [Centaurea solstitialis]